jgi:hypothetical protein
MKKTIAIALACVLTVFSLVTVLLLPEKNQAPANVLLVEPISEMADKKVEPASESPRKQMPEEVLPDYHPDKIGVEAATARNVISKPPALEETVASVESSLSERIRVLNQNLGDKEAKASLQRQLSGSKIEAYKKAVIWTVKNAATDAQDQER